MSEQTKSNDEVMNEEEACQLLSVCGKTLRKYRKLGQIPFVRIGVQIRYLRSKLLTWLAAGGTSQR